MSSVPPLPDDLANEDNFDADIVGDEDRTGEKSGAARQRRRRRPADASPKRRSRRTRIRCPDCQAVQVVDPRADEVLCTACLVPMRVRYIVEAARSRRAAAQNDSSSALLRWEQQRRPLRTVSTGLGMILWGFLGQLFAVLYLAVCAAGVVRGATPFDAPPGFMVAIIVLLGSVGLAIVGECVCLAVPSGDTGKGALGIALFLRVVVIGLGLMSQLVERSPFGPSVNAFDLLGGIATFAQMLAFAAFLSGLAKHVDAQSAASEAILYATLLVVLTLGSVLAFTPLGIILPFVLIAVALTFVRAITKLRQAIETGPSLTLDKSAAVTRSPYSVGSR